MCGENSLRTDTGILSEECKYSIHRCITQVYMHLSKLILNTKWMHFFVYKLLLRVDCKVSGMINILKCKIHNIIDMFSIKPNYCGQMGLYVAVNSFSSNYFFNTLNMTWNVTHFHNGYVFFTKLNIRLWKRLLNLRINSMLTDL